jgi:DNA-binding LacI/PurR family transcriptional regulator
MTLISEKGLRDGEKLPSEKNLAEVFQVNHLTIRRALALLEGKGEVHKVPSKGNFVGKASKMDTGSGLIGVLYPEDETFYYEILSGLESRMALAGYSPVVHISRWSPEREKNILEKFARLKVEGIIAVPNVECAALYRPLKIPVVFFDTYISSLDIPYVITDDTDGALMAVEHLVSLGHKRIAYVGSVHEKTSESRKAAYLEVLARHGIPLRPEFCLEKEYSREWGYNAAGQLLETLQANSPTALFCGNDAIASGVMSYLNSRHIKVPAQVSVLGFGNVGYSEVLGLSTVDQPRSRITNAVWKNMRGLLAGQSTTGGTVIPPSLIIRKTTAAVKK